MEVALGPGAGNVKQPSFFLDITAVSFTVLLNRPPMGKDIVFTCGQKDCMKLQPLCRMYSGQPHASILFFIVIFIFGTQGAVFQELLYSFPAFGYAEKFIYVFQTRYKAALIAISVIGLQVLFVMGDVDDLFQSLLGRHIFNPVKDEQHHPYPAGHFLKTDFFLDSDGTFLHQRGAGKIDLPDFLN